jgi:hypothetical protein
MPQDPEPGKLAPKGRRWLERPSTTSLEMWLLVVWVLFLLFVLIPWIANHGG